MSDFLVRGSLAELDADLEGLLQLEAERQYRRLILIPSESAAPIAVRQTLASAFQNIYAEGYPDEATRWMSEEEILDYDAMLGYYRRYSDPRYYKGVEYVDILEALVRRRCAETFAANGISPDDLYINVQALSGAPANNAIYHALVEPGETIMGMNLLHGGHLTHGSPVNRSGKYYNAVHYTVDPERERINYEAVEELAQQHKPKFIIAGYSSYPWSVDWGKFREISDSVGAILFADIAHVAGLVAAGCFPSPIGYADVITFTTHKSLCGPRGACIITNRADLSRKIDKAVFPGEQGGPHVNTFAAMALTFKLAQTDQFRDLQNQIIKNCVTLTERLKERGFRIPFGGTDTHMMNIDCHSVTSEDNTPLSGDQAARILDLAGIVVNRNTIPGDTSALNPSGVRMGTPWVTQRGFEESEIVRLADVIADLLFSTTPYKLPGRDKDLLRARIDFDALEKAKIIVRGLAEKAGIDFTPQEHTYPHFYYLDDLDDSEEDTIAFAIRGRKVRQYLNFALASDVGTLSPGRSQSTRLVTPKGEIDGIITRNDSGEFRLTLSGGRSAGLAAAWLRDLSDGYVSFDQDVLRKLPGPISISQVAVSELGEVNNDTPENQKPYYIGIDTLEEPHLAPLPDFQWMEEERTTRRTPLFDLHRQLGAKIIPFAGWEMPVWYSSVMEEHLAVRQAAGLFDVTHMGVYQVEGPDAEIYLDCVVGNDVSALNIGQSLYTHFLDPQANVIDDLLVYRRRDEKYLVVVNASNDDKDWAWLNAVKAGHVRVDSERPWARAYGRNVILRNLRDPKEGEEMRVDIALQGPNSMEILLALGCEDQTRDRIMALKRTQLCDAIVGGFDLIVSRTGYTGERMSFELFIHPEKAEALFKNLLEVGESYGLKPCGLGARDSLRTEAGLPLYGHEMGGERNLSVGDAGFGSYVKTYKPWFIGRKAFIDHEASRQGEVIRFRFNDKGVRMAHTCDPVVDKHGRMVGWVTSCAIDSQGYLTGQAFIDLKYRAEGTPIYIFQGAPKSIGKAPADMNTGDRITLPTPATVVNRFLK